ncbi:MAG: hypothetical protein EA425_09995 [Puniceicoccaceae bacterium]|nr:MAG: hypothetical protein EA425_09995 [Puniceicoccaceae bacterium]
MFFAALAVAEPIRAFFIGHSLMSDIPSMTRGLAMADGETEFSFRHQDIPGAPLRWQWQEKERESTFEPRFGGRYHLHLPQETYTHLIVTDSVPRGGEQLEAETVDYLGRFLAFAREHNPEVRVYYYETWHHLTSGTPDNSEYDTASPRRHLRWRQRLDADRAMWEDIVRRVNEAHPGAHPVRIIPGGQVLAAVHDAIEAGDIPEWSSINNIFGDEIHTNHYGKFIVALCHYAVLTGRSPVGLSGEIRDVWGNSYWDRRTWDGNTYPALRPETVRAVQKIVARVVFSADRN